MNEADPVSITLQGWADRELGRWRRRGLRRTAVERHLHDAARGRPLARLYRFAEGNVTMQPLRDGEAVHGDAVGRAALYQHFFESLLPLLPADLSTTICVDIRDRVMLPPNLPVFGFQRAHHEPTALLPDIDFLCDNFHEALQYQDGISYEDKLPGAVFAGATTGGEIDLDCARRFGVPRLRAARFFDGHPDVDFRLPGIAQCTAEARAFLEQQSFCQAPRLSWPDQLRYRFLISMDGNGATCSRVAVALASNSVLLKYHSDNMLYYFPALVANEHYVPIVRDEDVLAVIAREREDPWHYSGIAKAANAFAARYLTRDRIMEYAARLIIAYADMLKDSAQLPAAEPARKVAVFVRGEDGVEYAAGADGWAGRPDGGVKLTGFRIVMRPPAVAPRILYRAQLENGRFTPTARDGLWCAGDETGTAVASIAIEPAPGSAQLKLLLEAHCAGGTVIRTDGTRPARVGAALAPMDAIRVRLT